MHRSAKQPDDPRVSEAEPVRPERPERDTPDFTIDAADAVSQAFLRKGARTFQQAARLIKELPYGRNERKDQLLTILSDGRGTCSTKHAILKQLADENSFPDIQLMTGMFRMHSRNTPAVAETLLQHGLRFIPEAHNYLRYQGRILDYTFTQGGIPDFENDLMEEHNIQPYQIVSYKTAYHKSFLKEWLLRQTEVFYSPEELWAIREECIRNLSSPRQ